MKFQKNNPKHYIIYFFIFLVYVTCIFIKFFNVKSKKEIITLTGHKLIGNLEVLFNNQIEENLVINYITFNYQDYIDLKVSYKKRGLDSNILYALKPLDVFKSLSSKLIVATHGVFFHKFLTKYLKIKTLYCGHAIEGAYPVEKNNKLFKDLQHYSEVWMYSDFEKDMFVKDFNYPHNNLKVNGYPRVHYLLENGNKKNILKKTNNISNKIVVYAPTASRNDKAFLNSTFSPFKLENLKKFDKFFEKINATLIIKTHLNDKFSNEIESYFENSTFIKHTKNLNVNYDYDYLIMSDMLLTDYSTVYVDYLVLDKPVIFVAPPDPNKNRKYSKVIENNDIHRILTFESLLSFIEHGLLNNKQSGETALLKELIFNDLNVSKILDNSFEAIKKLV
jgi:CDP-glycerol glycerophosphotransferase (TagB/SpsB family)